VPPTEAALRLNEIMNALNTFGFFAVTAMLVCYAMEDRSPWFVLAFAGSCALGSAYGFLQGACAFRSGRGHLGTCGVTALAKPN
jgi:hypothetical protein